MTHVGASYIDWSQEEGVKESMWCMGLRVAPIVFLLGPWACLSSWVGAKMDENSIYGKFHWTHKSDFFNFSIGVPIHKKKPR